jgi:hypothetical protein
MRRVEKKFWVMGLFDRMGRMKKWDYGGGIMM